MVQRQVRHEGAEGTCQTQTQSNTNTAEKMKNFCLLYND